MNARTQRMHTPACDACYPERTHDAYGLTGNGEFLCVLALAQTFAYAIVHVPEAVRGITLAMYVEECAVRMREQMDAADAADAEAEEARD